MDDVQKFLRLYWKQYIELEKEFTETIQYVAIDREQENSYSSKYAKLLLQLGSECDIQLKAYCSILDPSFSGENIDKYRTTINSYNSDFASTQVILESNDSIIQPWIIWTGNKDNPWWWRVYNKVKHERTSIGEIDGVTREYYKFANQKYTVEALAALYSLEICIYRERIKNVTEHKMPTPVPGSRLFHLTGPKWNDVKFFKDVAFYIEDETLFESDGEFPY